MVNQNEIQEFISRRFPTEDKWLNGNCYWFAHILCERFPDLDIYYEPIEGHFYAGDGNLFYDWFGAHVHKPDDKRIKLSVIHTIDPLWHARLIRDCKN